MKQGLAMAVALAIPASAAAQVPQGVTSPDAVVSGFVETCQAGFPDFARIATAAKAAGFLERTVSPLGVNNLPAGLTLPRAFQKGEAMVTLMEANPAFPASRHACQISAMIDGKADLPLFAAQVQRAIGAGEPHWQGKGDAAVASWSGLTGNITAAIQRNRRVRSYSIQISQ